MNDILFYAFQDELEKIAVSAGWIAKRLGRASNFPEFKGTGGLGKRQEAIRSLREQGGYGDVIADTASKNTRAQMGRVLGLVHEKRRRMLQKPPRVTGNPKSLARAQQFSKDIDTLSHLGRNVLEPVVGRIAFPTMAER